MHVYTLRIIFSKQYDCYYFYAALLPHFMWETDKMKMFFLQLCKLENKSKKKMEQSLKSNKNSQNYRKTQTGGVYPQISVF